MKIEALCDCFLAVAKDNNSTPDLFRQSLFGLRKALLLCDDWDNQPPWLPTDEAKDFEQAATARPNYDKPTDQKLREHRKKSLRGKVWQALLGISQISSADYFEAVQKGECANYKAIRNDSFRTFPRAAQFQCVVEESEIIRVLNGFILNNPRFKYVQGMNAICGPFLFCMPEVEAYHSFCHLMTCKFPLYWVSYQIGAEAGCKLVDRVLSHVDSQLFHHLDSHNLISLMYAFSCVSSLSASVRPFSELLKLWDFYMAFGAHFNVLCVVAQIISMRQILLKSDKPKSILDYRKWPSLRARYIINIAMSILPQLPPELYHQMCLHATDPQVASLITERPCDI